MFNEWLYDNKQNFLLFGDMFINALTDPNIVEDLAHKDLEKLARVFRIIFLGSISDATSGESSAVLREIFDYLKGADDDVSE